MHIQVLHNYGGRLTQERRILPGVYEENDPRIFGLAHYLVQNGHAIAISAPLMPAPVPAKTANSETSDEPAGTDDAGDTDAGDGSGSEEAPAPTAKRKHAPPKPE